MMTEGDVDDVERPLLQRIAALEWELANSQYRGNSISYIYDKMTCYQTQVGIAFDALRAIGFDSSDCNDNREIKVALEWFVTAIKMRENP